MSRGFQFFLFHLVCVWARILHTRHHMRAGACIPMSNYHMFPDMHVAPLSSFTLITFSITFLGHIHVHFRSHSARPAVPRTRPQLTLHGRNQGVRAGHSHNHTVLSGFIFIIFHFGQASGNWGNQFERKSAKSRMPKFSFYQINKTKICTNINFKINLRL